MTYTAYREVEVMDGRDLLSTFEVRYTFTVTAGRKAVTWQNAVDGFSPAEPPEVEIRNFETRWHPSHQWQAVQGQAWDMLTAEIPDAWFIQQATEAAQ